MISPFFILLNPRATKTTEPSNIAGRILPDKTIKGFIGKGKGLLLADKNDRLPNKITTANAGILRQFKKFFMALQEAERISAPKKP